MFQHQANAPPATRRCASRCGASSCASSTTSAGSAGRRDEEVWNFMAKGMFLNVIAALDLPERYLPDEEPD